MDAKALYAARLKTCLAVNARMDKEQVRVMVGRFESLAAKIGEPDAFKSILEQWGNERDLDQTCAGIREELERFNREHPGVCADRAERIRRHIRKLNENLSKLQIEVSGVDVDAEKLAGRNIKVALPKFAREQLLVATAKYRGQEIPIQVLVR